MDGDLNKIINKMFETSEAREEANNEVCKVLSGISNKEVQNNIIKGFKEIFRNAKEAAREAQEFLKSKGFNISEDNMLNNLNCANDVRSRERD